MVAMGIILETKDLTKKFGDFTANDKINLTIEEGEIKGIVGENGAGKSTLMNMLYWQFKPTSGDIFLRGQKVEFNSPRDAIKHGIGMVHQHFMLVPSFTVCENIFLGTEIADTRVKFIVDAKKEQQICRELIKKYGFELDVNEKVENLSVGQQQKIEILKMLYRNVDLLILDEPTSVLTPQEVDELLLQLKELKAHGKTIILITHKLREVKQVSDSVTVIKRGKIIGDVPTNQTNEAELAQMMVGRKVLLTVQNDYQTQNKSEGIYSVKNLTTINTYGNVVVDHVDFEINKGEIYGIAGVEGNGQSELVKLLSGMMEAVAGTITYKGTEITNIWADELRSLGIAIIPEDRYTQGLCQDMSLSANSIAGSTGTTEFKNRFGFDNNKIRRHCQELIDQYEIHISEFDGNVSQLSGGNAQKLIIAREMRRQPDLLIACQPTRGVDIGAIEFIHQQILDFRNRGGAVLLISSELSEIMSLSDRIGVMYKGKIIGEVNPQEATEIEIGLLMAGTVPQEARGHV
jgi:simple sugar transport system ATP-binding protein